MRRWGTRVSGRFRTMITRLLMTVPVVGVAAASPVEAGTPHDGLAIARVEQIRQQLRVQDDKMACSDRRQLAQWYNFPNWPNWKNWNDWANRHDRR